MRAAFMLVVFVIVCGLPVLGGTYFLQSVYGEQGGAVGAVLGVAWGLVVGRLVGAYW